MLVNPRGCIYIYIYIYIVFLIIDNKDKFYIIILVQSVKLNKYCVKLNIKTLFKIKREN